MICSSSVDLQCPGEASHEVYTAGRGPVWVCASCASPELRRAREEARSVLRAARWDPLAYSASVIWRAQKIVRAYRR